MLRYDVHCSVCCCASCLKRRRPSFFVILMQSEATVLSKSVRQRPSMKKVSGLAASASVEGATGLTSLESGKPSKNALSGIVRSCVIGLADTPLNVYVFITFLCRC